MKKSLNTLITVSAVFLVASGINSCSEDFLDEELKTQRNTEYFATPEGIAVPRRWLIQQLQEFFHGQEQLVSTNQCGTDEFVVGGDQAQQTWNDYNSNLGSMVPNVPTANVTKTYEIWDMMYKAISDANMLLANVDAAITDADKQAV